MKNYYRQFITLIQERADYALAGGEAAGRIVLEARGETARANVYIQDISPQNSYKLAFAARRGDSTVGVVVGSIVVGERGKFEGRFEFDSVNICNSGISCADIEGAMVLVAGTDDDAGGIVAPLLGFKATPWQWRSNFSFEPCNEDLMVKQQEHEQKQVHVHVHEQEQVHVHVHEQEHEQEQVHEQVQEQSHEHIAARGPVNPVVDTARVNQFFASHPAVNAFGSPDNVVWVAVTPSDVQHLGGLWEKALDSQHLRASFERYRHILIGKEQESHATTYLLAVPDVFRADASCGGMGLEQEYCTFRLCRPSDSAEGAPGYWLREIGKFTYDH